MPRAPKRRRRPRVNPQQPAENRPNANARGYTYRWRRYREAFLAKPENALCRRCKVAGKVTPTTQVDHIVPVTGPQDPKFWDPGNHQGLCDTCHSRKTATEDYGRGRKGGR